MQLVATSCQSGAHGKEGVDGSSPSEGLRGRANESGSPRFGGVSPLRRISTLDGVFRRWLTKARGDEPDERLDIVADDWRREAAIQELESVMWRVGVLTATAHELVEDMEVPGGEASPAPSVLSDARDLVKVIDVHERDRELWPSHAWLSALQFCGVLLGV